MRELSALGQRRAVVSQQNGIPASSRWGGGAPPTDAEDDGGVAEKSINDRRKLQRSDEQQQDEQEEQVESQPASVEPEGKAGGQADADSADSADLDPLVLDANYLSNQNLLSEPTPLALSRARLRLGLLLVAVLPSQLGARSLSSPRSCPPRPAPLRGVTRTHGQRCAPRPKNRRLL